MKILVTGGTGFVGRYVVDALFERGHHVCSLVRSPQDRAERLEPVVGDLFEPASLDAAVTGCEAVVHLVGIIEEKRARGITFDRVHTEGTRNVVQAARRAGIGRFVHMSANGARPDGVSGYQTSKWAAEEIVRSAGFAHHVIFRPSVIFGRPGAGQPEFCSQLANTLVGPFPILPVFGDGRYELRPVAIEDVARAFADAVTLDAASGRSFCVGGPESFAYVDILDIIARGMGRNPKPKIHQPVWLVRPAVETLGRWGLLPITPDQFRMLLDGNTCDPAEFVQTFGGPLVPFTPANLAYLKK